MLGQFALVALLGARFDLGFGFGDFLQPLLAARQLLRDRHAIGNIRLIGGFGLRQKLSNLGLQLRLDFASMLVRERAVLAGIGVDLRAVQRDRPICSRPISRAKSKTLTNDASISFKKRLRKAAIVS